MNQGESSIDILQNELASGLLVRLPKAGLLARQEGEKILISARQYTARLSLRDFIRLYGGMPFTAVQEQQGISEEKDEEYYAWRRVKQ